MGWLLNFSFATSGIIAGGVALVASPIIIHLINRLRYRRVRFAAMEFLLESQQKNRRRVLIEQLLLLLLRILIVLALALLVARLIVGADQLAMFAGVKTHHVVVLDDSASMQDSWEEEVDGQIKRVNGFDKAKSVVSAIANEGSRLPGSQQLTVLLLSRPKQPLFDREDVNEDFLTELKTKLDNQQPTHRTFALEDGLDAARKFVKEDETGIRHVHVVSDFRRGDWLDSQAISDAVLALDKEDASINLVRTIPARHENLAITDVQGEFHLAVAEVPIEVTVKVRNDGEKTAKDVRLSVFVDGQKTPGSESIQAVEPGETESHSFYVWFGTGGMHEFEVRLEGDDFTPDDRRFVAVEVAEKRRVLIVDGDFGQGREVIGADFLKLALVPEDTGFEPLVQSPDFLRKNPLDPFTTIYMVNVGPLERDAVKPLEEYVAEGGGLVWFLGSQLDSAFYTDTLYGVDQVGEKPGLFPVPLKPGRRELQHLAGAQTPPDVKFTKHPIFAGLFEGDAYILAPFVNVWEYVAVDQSRKLVDENGEPALDGDGRPVVWQKDDNQRRDGVTTIATLRNGEPFAFEHGFGEGRIVTFLTTAGPEWNNWTKMPPSYVPTIAETQARVARTDRVPERRLAGEPIPFDLDAALYETEGRYSTPDVDLGTQKLLLSVEQDNAAEGGARLRRTFGVRDETDLLGVYRFTLPRQAGTAEQRWVAVNAPVEEGQLTLATDDDIERRMGQDVDYHLQAAGNFGWIKGGDEGDTDVHRVLLALLVVLLVCEQLLAWRLSFHSQTAGATR